MEELKEKLLEKRKRLLEITTGKKCTYCELRFERKSLILEIKIIKAKIKCKEKI